MKEGLYRLIVVCVSVISWFGAMAWDRSAEPRFDGKPLSQLAQDLIVQPVGRDEILAQVGPALVPYFIQEIQACGMGGTDLSYQSRTLLYARIPHQCRPLLSPPILRSQRRLNAVLLLEKLGPSARLAVPELTQLLESETLRHSAMRALVAIGPPARSAVPRLLEQLQEEPYPFLCKALKDLGTDPNVLVPALMHAQTNGPGWLQLEAASVLGSIHR